MVITILALRRQFEDDYFAELGKKDKYILDHPEDTKRSFFRRRINGEYDMLMVEMGWTCYQLGAKAGVEMHGRQEQPATSPEQADE